MSTPLSLGSDLLPTRRTIRYSPYKGATGFYTQYEGGTQPGAALEAMRSDAARFEGKVGEMEAARRQGLDALSRTLSGQAGEEQRTRAAKSAEALRSGLAERTGRVRESLASAEEAAAVLGPQAEQRRQEALAASEQRRVEALREAEQMKQEALQGFSDDTAMAIQSQRATLRANLKQQKERILSEAAARGMDPDSPEVQQQMFQVEMAGIEQLGQLANQAALAYNDARSKLRLAYDDMATRMRGLEDQLSRVARTEADKYVGLSQAQGAQIRMQVAQVNESLEMAAQQEHRAFEQMLSQNMLAADQLELAGAESMADFVRNWDIAMAPMAPIISLAASMTSDLKQRAGLNAAAVASGINPDVNYAGYMRPGPGQRGGEFGGSYIGGPMPGPGTGGQGKTYNAPTGEINEFGFPVDEHGYFLT